MKPNTDVKNETISRELTPTGQGEVEGVKNRMQKGATPVFPPVDIFEDESGFTVIADLPGVSRDRLNVRVDGDSLVIEAAAASPVGDDMTLVYGEVLNPHYRRSFMLSRELDPSKIEARLDSGVLRLNIPKAEEAKPRRIEVMLA